jgi:NAD(P)-dependent dehydrogenase (short-subunit alcohol dehydrogenase family)
MTNALVTGGHSGLGLGLVEALVRAGTRVTVLARDAHKLRALQERLHVEIVVGDITDRALAAELLRTLKPSVVALNAGATPRLAPIDEQRWEDFTACWEQDVKAGLHWIQEALRLPLPAGSRMLISSSGAAVQGSPLSGGYAGAKRMLWIMANYANGVSEQRGLGIHFQVLVPMQMVGATARGSEASEAYALRKGVTPEQFLAGFGAPLSLEAYGSHALQVLNEPGVVYGIKGDFGLRCLDQA